MDTQDALAVEHMLGGPTHDTAVAVSTVQLAIQMCLEVLGSRTHMIPCILPVNASPDTLSAVMRAGAQPVLLDINGGTLQMCEKRLKEALDELESAAVILTRPGGHPVSPALLDLVQDVPTIVDTRLLPHTQLDDNPDDLCGTFNVFDLTQVCGAGAVIRHKYKQQLLMLRTMRSGVMGHSGELPGILAALAKIELSDTTRNKNYLDTVEKLRELLWGQVERGIIPWLASPGGPTPLLVFVPNAKRAITQLRSHQIEASQGSYPLHLLDEVRGRFKETPEYPVAEQVSNHVLAVPCDPRRASEIAKIILSVSYA